MKRTINYLLIVVSALALTTFYACEKVTDDKTTEYGRNYMPLQIGHWVLYDVDSLYYDDFNKTTYPVRSQQRFEVVDTFRDAGNRLSYTINVLSRKATTESFKPDRVIHVTPTPTSLEWSERNNTYISLIFPVVEGATWDGTAMISHTDPGYPEFYTDKWQYEYTAVNKPFEGTVKYFGNTVTVNQIDETLNDPDTDTTVYAVRNYSKEIFAANVGLVRRERTFWEFQPMPSGSGYRKGYSVTMTAVDYKE